MNHPNSSLSTLENCHVLLRFLMTIIQTVKCNTKIILLMEKRNNFRPMHFLVIEKKTALNT